MNDLINIALNKIKGKTDEQLAEMDFYELLDILLALEAAVELKQENNYSGLLEEAD